MAKKKDTAKYLKIGIPIAVVVLIIIISLVVLLGSKTRVAFLNIEDGTVQVDSGSGWAGAEDGMDLALKDKVRTLEGSAVIVLYESILVQLDPNTEVSIEDLSKKNVKVRQESGSTWNKFAKIAGIQSFEVETPTTVATVRGTSFWVDEDGVGVESGNVRVRFGEEEFDVGAGHKAVRERLEVIPFDERDRARAILKKQIIINRLKDLREQEIQKHKTTYNMVKNLKGWTDDDVKRYMDRLDRGEFNEEDLRKKTILPSATVDKFAKLTKEIRAQNADIEQLKSIGAVRADDDDEEEGSEGGRWYEEARPSEEVMDDGEHGYPVDPLEYQGMDGKGNDVAMPPDPLD